MTYDLIRRNNLSTIKFWNRKYLYHPPKGINDMNTDAQIDYGRKLIFYGIMLFLIGLITGLIIPLLQNPRMGLSSHLEGIMNGIFLMIIGLIWPKLTLTDKLSRWCYALALFGTFTNWFTTLLAGVWGAGSEMMPLAG